MYSNVNEGSILLANLIGQLSKTEEEGVYCFEHRMLAPSTTFTIYKNYLTRRLDYVPSWPSSAGCAFEPVGEILPLPDGKGFNVLIRPKASIL